MRRALRVGSRVVSVGLGLLAAALAWLWLTTDLTRERFARPEDALTITDRHGVALRRHRPDGHDRRWVALEDISHHLIDAVLAVEDDRFREHSGVDARATGRALLGFALPGRRLSGGSTITQQVIKLVYGRPSGLWSKPREIVRAVILERRFDKDWILEQYLNRLPYGDQIVGVARAAEIYFGKPPSDLTLGEAALIAGIPQAPSALNPRRHLDAALRRRRVVLRRMRDIGRIDEGAERRALGERITIHELPVRPWRAPRAADAALAAWRDGGMVARRGALGTSLDLPLQREAERILRTAVRAHAGRGVTNAAAVVVSNRSGEVLAYVGAAEQGTGAVGGWLDLVTARRQPGSTLKPFVYELLFERGSTAATLLDDIHRPMVGRDGALFRARDYDGEERGPVRARAALSASLNLAALDAARRVGARGIVARLRELGMSHLDDASRYGAAIVLGGADVSVLDLAEAYATLARGGSRQPVGLARRDPSEGIRIMDAGAAAIVTDILRDRAARRDAFGDDLHELFGEPFALKTGTSSGWRDAWAAVYTDDLTVVVWLGDPAGHRLGALSGFRGAARPATRILAAAHRRIEALGIEHTPPEPAVLARAHICASTGALAGPRCPRTIEERFIRGTLPAHVCDAHSGDGSVELPRRYARWMAETHPAGFSLATARVDEGRAPRVAYPPPGARLLVDGASAEIPLRATVRGETVDARWEVDGVLIEGRRWRPSPGDHVLVALLGEMRSDAVPVSVRAAR